jgi:hypothetical protein
MFAFLSGVYRFGINTPVRDKMLRGIRAHPNEKNPFIWNDVATVRCVTRRELDIILET